MTRFARDKTWRIRGTLDAERLATRSDAEGTLVFKLIDERRLPYRLRFRGDDGRFYELSGQKEWLGVAPLESMTTLPASLYDDAGEEIARATLRFDLTRGLGAVDEELPGAPVLVMPGVSGLKVPARAHREP